MVPAFGFITTSAKCLLHFIHMREADRNACNTSEEVQQQLSNCEELLSQLEYELELPQELHREIKLNTNEVHSVKEDFLLLRDSRTSKVYLLRLCTAKRDSEDLKAYLQKLWYLSIQLGSFKNIAIMCNSGQSGIASSRFQNSELDLARPRYPSSLHQISEPYNWGRYSSSLPSEHFIPQSFFRPCSRDSFIADALCQQALNLRKIDGSGAHMTENFISTLQESASYGSIKALHFLALYYQTGVFLENDHKRAISYLMTAASLGFESSYCTLFDIYLHGIGEDKNHTECVNLAKMVRKVRKPVGFFLNANLKILGIEGADRRGALRDLKRVSSIRGDTMKAYAIYLRAIVKHQGNDHQKAFWLMKQAADCKHYWAIIYLVMAYTHGIGVKIDEEKARYYTSQASRNKSQNEAISAALVNADLTESYCTMNIFCDMDRFLIGVVNDLGIGLRSRKPEEAITHYRVSAYAQPCSPAAQFLLALKYWHGDGVERDEAIAKYLYHRAKRNGITASLFRPVVHI